MNSAYMHSPTNGTPTQIRTRTHSTSVPATVSAQLRKRQTSQQSQRPREQVFSGFFSSSERSTTHCADDAGEDVDAIPENETMEGTYTACTPRSHPTERQERVLLAAEKQAAVMREKGLG